MSLPSVVFQSPSSVHVWWIDLTRIGDEEDVLSPEERQRAARLRQPRDRARWVAARGALRRILAGYAGVAPRELRLENGPHGKPAIGGGSPVCFSLSHAGGRAVLAVAWQREVGVDLEPSDPPLPDEDLQRLITTICTADEARELDALPPTDRRETFLRFWTLKEAYLKGVGVGLTREPRTVEVGIGHDCSRPPPEKPSPQPLSQCAGRGADPRRCANRDLIAASAHPLPSRRERAGVRVYLGEAGLRTNTQ